MKSRAGGKFGKNHSSITDAAVVIADIANACPHVKRVIHGVIRNSHRSSASSRRVKVSTGAHALRLSITVNASHQELYLFSEDHVAACDWMKPRAEEKGFTFVALL